MEQTFGHHGGKDGNVWCFVPFKRRVEMKERNGNKFFWVLSEQWSRPIALSSA